METDYQTFGSCMEKVVYIQTDVGRCNVIHFASHVGVEGKQFNPVCDAWSRELESFVPFPIYMEL